MADPLKIQIEQVRRSMEGLEAQRSILGDQVVNPALAALRQQLANLEQQAATEVSPAEERRLVTILFTDVVGSTSMAEKVDPEEWHQVLKKLHALLAEKVATHHGEVGQFLGDGMLAYFGLHEAGENDPENAIRAALDAQAAVAEQLSSEKIQMRAGIHTGLVVMGELGDAATHMEFTASGDSMNLAARLQSAAPTGGVLISHDTYRYVRGVFDLTPRPPLTVKGKSEPLQTYLVRQVKPRPFRSVSRGVAGVEARTVGREAELEALRAAYLRSFEEHGVVWAQLLGQPGVGKSRLLAEINDWTDLREETYRVLRARSFPDDASHPFGLVRRMWFDRFQIAEDMPLDQAEAKWVERFKEFSGQDDCEEAAHALGLLVGLPFTDSPHIKAMRNDPTQVKGRAFVVSRELLRAIRAETELVVLLEDLQWADAASWEYTVEVFLDAANAAQPNGMFLLGAARPEWQPPQKLETLLRTSSPTEHDCPLWGLPLALSPLDDQAVRELAQELLQRAADVPDRVIDLLVERSEGIPYYAEEMVNWFIDNGILDTHSQPWSFNSEKLRGQPLPATLQHLLLTRLSGLSATERAALQRGAIFGRHFWSGGLAALGVTEGAEVLAHLQPRGFVEAQPDSAFEGDVEWAFHHGLLQEVTYESVLKRERAALHKVAAEWMEQQARQAGRLEEFAGLLGAHCERAGDLSAAADWYIIAGKRAMSQGAAREAVRFYGQALQLLPPVDKERRWQVLCGRESALALLGEAAQWKADVAALRELAQTFNDDRYLAEAAMRQAMLHAMTGEIRLIEQPAAEALAAARCCGDEGTEARALAILTVPEVNESRHADATAHIEEALRIARHQTDESVLAYVLYRAAFCYGEMGDNVRADALQEEQIELSHRLGDRDMEGVGLTNRGANYLGAGLFKQCRPLFEQARVIASSLGSHRGVGVAAINLSEVYLVAGDLRKAGRLAEEALEQMTMASDKRGQAACFLTLGYVSLAMMDAPGAVRYFEQGYAIAKEAGLPGAVTECASGLASSLLLDGRLDEAGGYAREAFEYLEGHGWTGISSVGRSNIYCADVLDAIGEADKARRLVEQAHRTLMQMADGITIAEWRKALLENDPDNRALVERWERLQRQASGLANSIE